MQWNCECCGVSILVKVLWWNCECCGVSVVVWELQCECCSVSVAVKLCLHVCSIITAVNTYLTSPIPQAIHGWPRTIPSVDHVNKMFSQGLDHILNHKYGIIFYKNKYYYKIMMSLAIRNVRKLTDLILSLAWAKNS